MPVDDGGVISRNLSAYDHRCGADAKAIYLMATLSLILPTQTHWDLLYGSLPHREAPFLVLCLCVHDHLPATDEATMQGLSHIRAVSGLTK